MKIDNTCWTHCIPESGQLVVRPGRLALLCVDDHHLLDERRLKRDVKYTFSLCIREAVKKGILFSGSTGF